MVKKTAEAAELRCLLARRRRNGDIGRDYENDAYRSFERDLAAGHLRLRAFDEGFFVAAVDLVERLDDTGLRTLDALHLAIARADGGDRLATADATMEAAARKLGLGVRFFGDGA